MPYVPTTALFVINALTMGSVPMAHTRIRDRHARYEQIQKKGLCEKQAPEVLLGTCPHTVCGRSHFNIVNTDAQCNPCNGTRLRAADARERAQLESERGDPFHPGCIRRTFHYGAL
jgi:hypothetical protein